MKFAEGSIRGMANLEISSEYYLKSQYDCMGVQVCACAGWGGIKRWRGLVTPPTVPLNLPNNASSKSVQQPISRRLVSTAFADAFLWPRLLCPVLIRDWKSGRRLASQCHDGTHHGGGARLAAGRRPSLTCTPETHKCAHAPLGQGQLAARTMKSKCLVVFRAWVIC